MSTLQRTLAILLPVLTLAACQKNMTADAQNIRFAKHMTGIVNGKEATGTEAWAPSVVGIATEDALGLFIFCSGSVVDETTVITAAHCMEGAPAKMFVVFGLGEQDKKAILRPVVHHEFHEKWLTNQMEEFNTHDLGMAHFADGLPEGYAPAKLLEDASVLQNGTEIVLAGYGVTSGRTQAGSGTLRYTTATIRNVEFSETEIQADEVKSGTCNGDSGGPAMVVIDGTHYLFGITSRGASLCNDDGIYTVIPSFNEWVTTHAAAH